MMLRHSDRPSFKAFGSIVFCFVLFCFVLFCFVLFFFVLFCFVLFCFVLFCFVCFVNSLHDNLLGLQDSKQIRYNSKV